MLGTGMRRLNSDGTRNVFCRSCSNFIGTVSQIASIHTATCVICQAEIDGVELSTQQIADLRAVRYNGQVISEAVATFEHALDPLQALADNPDDAAPGRKGYWVKTITRAKFVIGAAVEAIKEAIPESKKVALEKRKKRVFNLPIDDPDVKQNKIED